MALAPNAVRLVLRVICLPTASVLLMGQWRLRHVAIFLAALGQMAVRLTINSVPRLWFPHYVDEGQKAQHPGG